MQNQPDRKQKFTVLRPVESLSRHATPRTDDCLMEDWAETIEDHQVRASIMLLNKYIHRFNKIAISAITPLPHHAGQPPGFRIRVEGPANQVRTFSQLLDEANLKIG